MKEYSYKGFIIKVEPIGHWPFAKYVCWGESEERNLKTEILPTPKKVEWLIRRIIDIYDINFTSQSQKEQVRKWDDEFKRLDPIRDEKWQEYININGKWSEASCTLNMVKDRTEELQKK